MAEKFAIVKCVNGNFGVLSEHPTKKAGIIAWHQACASHWNAPDVATARINLVDENMYVVDGRYTEWIDNNEPEPNEEA